MSKGLGRIEKAVLANVQELKALRAKPSKPSSKKLASIFGPAPVRSEEELSWESVIDLTISLKWGGILPDDGKEPLRGEIESVRRAVKSLAAKGFLELSYVQADVKFQGEGYSRTALACRLTR